jgi:hypothetical protein
MVLEQEIQQKLDKHRAEKAKVNEENKSKTFTKEELDRIAIIKQTYDALTLRMGQLHFELKSLTTEEVNLEKSFAENRKAEVNFAKELTDKYGKGSLDIDTGIFTPSE